MNHVDNKGFTLIELMLAMAFVSMLLLAIAMTTIQIGNIYNRGLLLKEVNQAGSSLSSEIQNGITSSTAFNLDNSHYVSIKNGGELVGGRLCIGQYSFIWNYGDAIARNNSKLNKYSDKSTIIRFVKVPDSDGSYCSSASAGNTENIDSNSAVELLNAGQHSLAIHSFDITTANSASDSATGQRLYSISYSLGTNNNDQLSSDEGENSISYSSGVAVCKLNSQIGADPSYCYINKFNIIARAGNSDIQ